MDALFKLGKPLLHKLDPEDAHTLTIKGLKPNLLPACRNVKSPRLEQTVCGLAFKNPVGLAAGFDKNAEVISPILGFGFGFTEVGTVTPKPQEGNPRPRVFRDPSHEAVINRMGFPNGGLDIFKKNVENFRAKYPGTSGILGLNIGMNKDQEKPEEDYKLLVRELADLADYLTVNISSPNTPGLRNLQSKENLVPLLKEILEERSKASKQPPLFVKLAPDLEDPQIAEISQSVLEAGIDGLILTNTTLDRHDFLPENFRSEMGGLSGKPLTQKSTEIIGKFYKQTEGKLPIIGVGGVSSAQDAYDKIKAGASLTQLYSALIYQGPGLVNHINDGLLDLLDKDGYNHISEAIGNA